MKQQLLFSLDQHGIKNTDVIFNSLAPGRFEQNFS